MRRLVAYLMAVALAGPAVALSLDDCARTTHISHGGEDMHRDLGAGRVMWRDWWSQEGTFSDYLVAECSTGQTLRFRTAEERMNDRLPFDRTDRALDILAEHERGARVFATLDRIAADLDKVARDVTVMPVVQEACACAALYPEMRGDKQAFSLG